MTGPIVALVSSGSFYDSSTWGFAMRVMGVSAAALTGPHTVYHDYYHEALQDPKHVMVE